VLPIRFLQVTDDVCTAIMNLWCSELFLELRVTVNGQSYQDVQYKYCHSCIALLYWNVCQYSAAVVIQTEVKEFIDYVFYSYAEDFLYICGCSTLWLVFLCSAWTLYPYCPKNTLYLIRLLYLIEVKKFYKRSKYTYTEKNTHSHFLSYLHELFVDLNKNCTEYTQG